MLTLTPVTPVTTLVCAFAILTIRQTYGQSITSCIFDSEACGCQTDKGLLSLKPFEAVSFETPVTSSGAQFFWNPCKDFTKGSVTAACIQSFFESGLKYDCGIHTSTTTDVENGEAVFLMDGALSMRHSKVTCKCGSGELLDFKAENPQGTDNMVFTSTLCCVGGGGSAGNGSSGLSVGSILLIVLICMVAVYLLVGVVVQTTVRKAQGMERIPQVQMWTALPGLIKDGVRFTFSGCRPKGYNEI